MEGDLGDTPMLPQGLTIFLAEGAAKEQDDTPGPFTFLPEGSPQLPSEAPSATPPIQEEPGLKSHPSHVLVNPSPHPYQSWRNQILLTTP